MTWAIVKVLPEPVTPSSTWSRSCACTPSTSSAMAVGWSPLGSYSDFSLNLMPPSDFSGRAGRCGTQGRCGEARVAGLEQLLQHLGGGGRAGDAARMAGASPLRSREGGRRRRSRPAGLLQPASPSAGSARRPGRAPR